MTPEQYVELIDLLNHIDDGIDAIGMIVCITALYIVFWSK